MDTLKFLRDEYNRRIQADKTFRGFPALMGDTSGVVDAGDGDVYVTCLDGQVLTIPNRRIGFGVKPIFIGTTVEDPGTLQVLGEWNAYAKPWPPNTVPHATQHGYGYFDVDWIELERFRWLLVLPLLSSGNFYVQIYGGSIKRNNTVVTVTNQTLNLAASVPATGALYALIQSNSSGAVSAKVDAGLAVTGKEFLTNAKIPAVDTACFALCAIALYEAQPYLQRDIRPGHVNDFVDLRFSIIPTGADIQLNTSAFNGFLNAADDTVQKMADNYDDHTHPGAGGDASTVTYTPAVPADWNGCIEPDFVDEALDELADRVDDLENANPPACTPDASVVTYTPNVPPHWNDCIDYVDEALDELCTRVEDLEWDVANIDAADVIYTPAVPADWTDCLDPGDVDNALDQLAERTTDLEAGGYVHPNHSGDVTSVGDGAQALVKWSAGNVIYVPLNGDIQDYIDAATAGDTLILASGEYIITASITVDKELNIMGQGNAGFYTIPSAPAHGTVISSVTASVTAFNVTSDNVRIAHLSINLSGAASTGIGTANNLTGLVLTNIDVIVTCTGLAQGFMIQGTNAVLRNLTFYITSTNGSCSGLYVYNINSTTADKIVDCFTVTGTTKGASGDNWSFLAENNNCSKKITLNLSNSVCKALAGTAADIAVAAISATTNNAVVNCYLCELSGEDYDVYQEGDGGDNELNVGGSVLVNNLVYGTVTYRAAMAAGIGVFGTSLETPAIKITTGAGAGKVLTSDADGDATWEVGGGGGGAYYPFQARLTLETGVPISTTDQTAKTVLYLTAYQGETISLHDGVSAWDDIALGADKSIKVTDAQTGTTTNGNKIITGLTDTSQLVVGMLATGTGIGAAPNAIASIDSPTQVTLSVNSTASAAVTVTFKTPAGSAYDVFAYNDAGAVKLELCAWTTATARATALTTQNGVKVKTGVTTRRYCGSVYCETGGQTELAFGFTPAAGGSAPKLFLYNEYNKVPAAFMSIDSTDSWAYTTSSYRAKNNSTGNSFKFFNGNNKTIKATAYSYGSNPGAAYYALAGFGVDTSTARSGLYICNDAPASYYSNGIAELVHNSAVGYHYIQEIEMGWSNQTFYGDAGGTLRNSGASYLTEF